MVVDDANTWAFLGPLIVTTAGLAIAGSLAIWWSSRRDSRE